jgi:protein-serine/threonine kinase
LVKEKSSGEIMAMKSLTKQVTIERGQEGHVKSERNLLSTASELGDWIVRLFYSFQDKHFLYFVLEYMPGGDLLGLLIKKDIFEEDFARFYFAEIVQAIEEIHKLGMIHRDIKVKWSELTLA